MVTISFSAPVRVINDISLVQIPAEHSKLLPSRGMVYAHGTVNGETVALPLEPDGKGSHWFQLDATSQKAVDIAKGSRVDVVLQTTDDWRDPVLAEDVRSAFMADPVSKDMWQTITPKARWEWVRWIRATNNADTRAKRIRVSIDKMHKGMRRPCCFNQSMCTVPAVSKSGVLL